MNKLRDLIRKEGKIIQAYLGKKSLTDYFRQDEEFSILNDPISIKGIVTTLSGAKRQWKLYGKETDEAKQCIIPARHKSLIENSVKIIIEGSEFYGNEDNSQFFEILDLSNDYIQVTVWRRIA